MELIEHGADLTAKNNAGLIPASLAGRYKYKPLGDHLRAYVQSMKAAKAVEDAMNAASTDLHIGTQVS
jgi:hypothetical protein